MVRKHTPPSLSLALATPRDQCAVEPVSKHFRCRVGRKTIVMRSSIEKGATTMVQNMPDRDELQAAGVQAELSQKHGYLPCLGQQGMLLSIMESSLS